MKFSKLSQLFLVSSIGLLVATVFTACAITTIDYVFVASSAGSGTSNDGQIEAYAADSQSGALRTVDSAVSSGGVNPVAMTVTSDYANLYVANSGSNNIVHFSIGIDGVLTAKDTLTLAAGTPIRMAVNTAGTYLYVISCTPSLTLPCTATGNTATLTEYALSSGTIGSAVASVNLNLSNVSSAYAGDILVPTGITVLANNSEVTGNAVFVSAYDLSAYNPGGTASCTSGCANPGWVFGFTIGSSGALTASTSNAKVVSPWEAGVKPTAIASDPTDRFVYITDFAQDQLIGYTIIDGSVLSFLPNGPFRTGNQPSAIIIDPRGMFIYVTNSLDSTVSPYEITLATGTPTASVNPTGSGTNSTDAEPVALVIDPALGRFVYTANFLGNSISGFRANPTSGALTATQATPYPTGEKPTAIVSVPHGNYSTQSVTP
ncbi:MAG: beta-propeller fold lactonase family protein [Terracidiphilus sp.]|jgi:6-phosphogluconolactonase (cycloisomerase 2 family)